MDSKLEKVEREQARWLILRALELGRPLGLGELTLLGVLHDDKMPFTGLELRRELDYLEKLGLIQLERDGPIWFAELTDKGVQVVQFLIPCPPGIARPQAW